MTHLIHRNLTSLPLNASKGEGVYLFDDKDKPYLDACGGAAISNLGHNNQRVLRAMQKQMQSLPFVHSAFFTTDVAEELGSRLTALAPGMHKALLLCGGSETVEAALKLSRQYFVEIGQAHRHLFIARQQSYHGNTLGALAVGGNEWRKRSFAPLLKEGQHISACYEYRGQTDDENLSEYALRVANELESKILELGPENVAGFVAETVVGATAGAVTALPGYFKRIREICDLYGIHLILDEVMCGTGRTGTMFAYEQESIMPDIVTLAKGLAAGYQPIGATLCQAYITDAIQQGSGFFQHGHSFMAHATAAAAALETLKIIKDDNLLENVNVRGNHLKAKLSAAFSDHPHVGDVRGRGLFIGIEYVQDKETKQPFDPNLMLHTLIKKACMQNGLLVYGMGGTINGELGNHTLLAPHYIINESHENEIIEKLVASVDLALAEIT